MATFRVNKTKNYTVMANYHLRDRRLSLKGKGLLSLMLSLPEEWDYSINGLATLSADGVASIRATLQELELYGYLERSAIRKNGRITDWQYDIFEVSKNGEDAPVAEFLQVENQEVEIPLVEKQQVENRTQINTKESNKEELSKDSFNIVGKPAEADLYRLIIEDLNRMAGTSFRPTTKDTRKHIHARLQEGYKLEDFQQVISNKCNEWKGTNLAVYLRPSTLFGSKFESYLNQQVQASSQPVADYDDEFPF